MHVTNCSYADRCKRIVGQLSEWHSWLKTHVHVDHSRNLLQVERNYRAKLFIGYRRPYITEREITKVCQLTINVKKPTACIHSMKCLSCDLRWSNWRHCGSQSIIQFDEKFQFCDLLGCWCSVHTKSSTIIALSLIVCRPVWPVGIYNWKSSRQACEAKLWHLIYSACGSDGTQTDLKNDYSLGLKDCNLRTPNAFRSHIRLSFVLLWSQHIQTSLLI